MIVGEEISFIYKNRLVNGIIERIDSDGIVIKLLTDYIGKNESSFIGETKWFQFNIMNK